MCGHEIKYSNVSSILCIYLLHSLEFKNSCLETTDCRKVISLLKQLKKFEKITQRVSLSELQWGFKYSGELKIEHLKSENI